MGASLVAMVGPELLSKYHDSLILLLSAYSHATLVCCARHPCPGLVQPHRAGEPLGICVTLDVCLSRSPFVAAFIAFAIAQITKLFTFYYTENRWDFTRVVGSGGMPSSHTSMVGTAKSNTELS